MAGYENILSKIVGSNNKLNVALTTFKALAQYKHTASFAKKHEEVVVDADETQDNDEVVSENKASSKESTDKKNSPVAPKQVTIAKTKAATTKKDAVKPTEKKESKPSTAKKTTTKKTTTDKK